MNDLNGNVQDFDEREAVESLLEIQNSLDQKYIHQSWNAHQQLMKGRNKHVESLNFTQKIKKSNPQSSGEATNFITKDKSIYKNKGRRANSLFDPMQIFKIAQQQVFLEQNRQQLNELSECGKRRIINNYSDEIRNLNVKAGNPQKYLKFKRDQHGFEQKDSNELICGQSVMIQVQSYDNHLNRKQMQYLMSKTLGSRSFRSHLSLQKKQGSLSRLMFQKTPLDYSLPKQLNNENIHGYKKRSKMPSRSRFTSYLNRKTSKQIGLNNNDQNISLDLSSQKNQDIEKSFRLLLNNLKEKKVAELKDQNKISYLSNVNQSQSKIFDKEGVFKQYEEQEVKALKRMRMNLKNMKNQDMKIVQTTKGYKNKSHQPTLKLSMDNHNQINDSIRISSPRRYYKRSTKRDIEQEDLKIFEIKKLA